MKARLKDGFEAEIIEENVGDWEFLEILSDIDEGETGLIVKAARKMLGRDGVDRLKNHLRKEDGRVGITEMVEAFNELLTSVNELKNS